MDKLQPVIDALKGAFNYIQDSGILDKIVAAVKEYLPKIIEMLKGLAG